MTSAAEDDLEAQQAAMTVEVPDLPADTVEDMTQRVRDADALLTQAGRTGATHGRVADPAARISSTTTCTMTLIGAHGMTGMMEAWRG